MKKIQNSEYEYIILWAWIYGAYIAKKLSELWRSVALVECDNEAFSRASFINQARVHNGYHYPRSFSTAVKSAQYFQRFNEEFIFAINDTFKKVYAISSIFSMTSGRQFSEFCKYSQIPCTEVKLPHIFREEMIEAAFETLEYSFDGLKIKDAMMIYLKNSKTVDLYFGQYFQNVDIKKSMYVLTFPDGQNISWKIVINATYASTNQILQKFWFELFDIKYELAELTLCEVEGIEWYWVTIMDGPFFSLMPFWLSGKYSLTSVLHTPHKTSYDTLPTFDCQEKNTYCLQEKLLNCTECFARPETHFHYMNQVAKKYLQESINIVYSKSLYAVKPILKMSELDDSRPTIIKEFSKSPGFYTILSGKINTMYDLDVLLDA